MLVISAIDCDTAARVIGHLTAQTIKKLVREDQLELGDRPEGETRVHVSRRGLTALVAERAPSWVNVRTWVDECLASDDPYVDAQGAATFLWVDPEKILTVLASMKARYITSGRNNVHVSRKWLAAVMAQKSQRTMRFGKRHNR